MCLAISCFHAAIISSLVNRLQRPVSGGAATTAPGRHSRLSSRNTVAASPCRPGARPPPRVNVPHRERPRSPPSAPGPARVQWVAHEQHPDRDLTLRRSRGLERYLGVVGAPCDVEEKRFGRCSRYSGISAMNRRHHPGRGGCHCRAPRGAFTRTHAWRHERALPAKPLRSTFVAAASTSSWRPSVSRNSWTCDC